MKREEKNALSRQRILEAAITEFSEKGYVGASLNTVCSEKGFSKGIIYHYFKDKDELYLICVKHCFDKMTQFIKSQQQNFCGTLEEKLQTYFDTRLTFFTENPELLGIFTDSAFTPPTNLLREIAACRREFDESNISILTRFLSNEPLRDGLSAAVIAEDLKNYIDFFNLRLACSFEETIPSESALRSHEGRCHRQLNMLLYGVIGEHR